MATRKLISEIGGPTQFDKFTDNYGSYEFYGDPVVLPAKEKENRRKIAMGLRKRYTNRKLKGRFVPKIGSKACKQNPQIKKYALEMAEFWDYVNDLMKKDGLTLDHAKRVACKQGFMPKRPKGL